MTNYEEFGFDKFLRKGIYLGREELEDDLAIRINQVPQSSINLPLSSDKVLNAINELYRISAISTGAALVANNSGARVITTINNPFAVCESTIYKGSISDNKQVPYGSDTIGNTHRSHNGYDLSDNANSRAPNNGLTYIHHVENNSGSQDVYYFLIRWRFIGTDLVATV